jgi:plastocyanin
MSKRLTRRLLAAAMGISLTLSTATAMAQQVAAAPAEIVIDKFKFGPMSLTVPLGTTVTWVNKDKTAHSVISGEGPVSFKSAGLDTDDKYEFSFTKPGTYKYRCSLHPQMTGTIVVQ